MKKIYCFLLFFTLLTISGKVSAQIYLYHPTLTKSLGESQPHQDEILLNSAQNGIGRAVGSPSNNRDRETGAPSFSEFSLTKSFDTFSTVLQQQSAYGLQSNENYEIRYYGVNGKGQIQLIYKVEPFEGIISGYSASSGGCTTDCPALMESFTINFAKIRATNVTNPKLPVFTYNLRTNGPNL